MSGELVSPSFVISEYFANLEKKQRNLVKRKVKLDSYKEMLKRGQNLSADQEKAVAEYDQVCQNIASLKETIDILGEIQTKVDKCVKETEKLMDDNRDKYAIDTLQRLVPILDLLSKLRSPVVRAAITKTTSQHQYASLENVSKGSIISLPSVADVDNYLSEAFKAPAMCLLKLARSDPSPINGKSKAVSYSDIRKLCLSLLVDEQVRSALAAPFAEIPKKKPSLASKESLQNRENSHSPSDKKDKRVNDSASSKSAEVPSALPPETLPAEVILNSVINPLKTNFNFLQASHVNTVPVLPVPSPPQEIMQKQIHNNRETVVMKSQSQTVQGKIAAVDLSDPKSLQKTHPNELLGVVTQKTSSTADEKVKRRTDRRGSNNKEVNHRAPGRVSPRDVANADLPQHKVSRRPGGPKSWADRARGVATAHTEPPANVVSEQPHHENGHGKPRKNQSPLSSQANINVEGVVQPNARPNGALHRGGGYRGGFGGRGRGRNSQYRGGRGRGSYRGSHHARGDNHSTDVIQTNQPIQSMC